LETHSEGSEIEREAYPPSEGVGGEDLGPGLARLERELNSTQNIAI